jgi:acyl-CoA thioesterase-1
MNRSNLIIIQKFIFLISLIFCGFELSALEKNTHRILVLGDSISAGYGLPANTSWVNLLQDNLKKNNDSFTLFNSSISGETSAGGKGRIANLLQQHQPNIVILELGANDALRGFPLNTSYQNLLQIIQICKAKGTQVLILGMRIPSNYGPEYTAQFANMFVDLSKNTKSALVPFFFEGIATKREYFQEDGIHPNQAAQIILLNNMLPEFKKLLK